MALHAKDNYAREGYVTIVSEARQLQLDATCWSHAPSRPFASTAAANGQHLMGLRSAFAAATLVAPSWKVQLVVWRRAVIQSSILQALV